MGNYEPRAVAQLASVVEDVARALAEDGHSISSYKKKALALRILELYENGITDPDGLRLDVMADSLWASSHPSCATQISDTGTDR